MYPTAIEIGRSLTHSIEKPSAKGAHFCRVYSDWPNQRCTPRQFVCPHGVSFTNTAQKSHAGCGWRNPVFTENNRFFNGCLVISSHFPCQDLESSHWNTHSSMDVSGSRLLFLWYRNIFSVINMHLKLSTQFHYVFCYSSFSFCSKVHCIKRRSKRSSTLVVFQRKGPDGWEEMVLLFAVFGWKIPWTKQNTDQTKLQVYESYIPADLFVDPWWW